MSQFDDLFKLITPEDIAAYFASGQVPRLPTEEEVNNVVDIEQVESLLQQTIAFEKHIEKELESLLESNDEIEAALATIEDIPIRIKPVQKETMRLLEMISSTSETAQTVSTQVKSLDQAREKVHLGIQKLRDAIDIKNCVTGVEEAMAKEDYETAAGHIEKYLGIEDKSIIDESASRQLKSAEQKLKEIVKQKLEHAIRQDDQPNIIRFCMLFAPLGLREEGLTRYSHYLRKLITAEAESIIKRLARPPKEGMAAAEVVAGQLSFADGLMVFYEFIARLVDEQQPLVERHFGGGGPMLFVIKNVQQQCDIHATKILQIFSEDFRINKMVEEIIYWERTLGPRQRRLLVEGREVLDPREVGALLDAIALLNHRTEAYDRFMRKRTKLCLEQLEKEKEKEK